MLLNNDIGENITITRSDEKCTIYKIHDDSGDGTMTCYNVLPGIKLLYNDFHMQRCFSNFQPQEDMIGIDYCHEGRIEWKLENNSYLYLQQGDLQITSKDIHSREFAFPTGCYQGITIAIYIEKAKKILDSNFAEFTIDINNLGRKFCTLKKPFIIHARDYIRHIFTGFYTVPDKICIPYFKVKVLELLLILNTIDLSGSGKELPYFSKEHVEAVKSIKELITEHIEQHFTLAELSSQFGIPLTSMKNCFKCVYGTSIYTYLRTYRIQSAAYMLRETNDSVTAIAFKVGYVSPSKFTEAFKKLMGISPLKYRKIKG